MHRTEGDNNLLNMFTNGPPGTTVEEDWLNSVQEEIAEVIEDAGLTLQTAGSDTKNQLATAIEILFLRAIAGQDFKNDLTLSYNAVRTLGINDGHAKSDDGLSVISLVQGGGFTKDIFNPFVVGDGNGSLDTDPATALASTWYHVFAIKNMSNGNVDVLTSSSYAAPTMPTGYTKKRWIGAILTTAGINIENFTQFGGEFLWNASPTLDVNSGTVTVAAASYALTVPDGVQVHALFNARFHSAAANVYTIHFYSPDISDQAGASTNPPLAQDSILGSVRSTGYLYFRVRTNTNQQIRGITYLGTVNLWIASVGWETDFKI